MIRRRRNARPTWIAVTLASLVAAIVPVAAARAANPVDVVFDPIDAEQSWTVPAGVTSIHVTLIGAKGSGGGGYPGGVGHNVSGDLTVTPGSTIYVEVGGKGQGATPGFNGGGPAGLDGNLGTAGSGGGASDIRTISRSNPATLDSRLMVAGGGGGVGHQMPGGHAGDRGNDPTMGGQPGSNTFGGGAGGVGDKQGSVGTLGTGGAGGSWCTTDACSAGTAGGGGGGGYYGGGGGAGMSADPVVQVSGSGAGGSAYTGSATNVSIGHESELDASVTIRYTPSSAPSSDLFISEYVDASSPNQAIEIYNGTGATVNLGSVGYQLEIYANGSSTATSTVPLVGSVADGDVFVVVREGSGDLFGYADQLAAGLDFTGNDAVALRRSPGGPLLDIFGQIGVDPGVTGWGTGEQITNDRTLVRHPDITAGRTVDGPFDPAVEWDVFPFQRFDFLGFHTVNAGGGGTPEPTSGPDSGTVDATISMSGSTVCIELSTASVDFGTGQFGQVGVVGTPEIVVTNCGAGPQALFARGTDATAPGAAWDLVTGSATCADTLGLNEYHLGLHDNESDDDDWALGTTNTLLQSVDVGSTGRFGPRLDTACSGSTGAGLQMSMQIMFTATESQP